MRDTTSSTPPTSTRRTRSETIVGKAVKDRRDAVVIATKAASPLGPGPFDSGSSRKHVVKACEDSLRRLGTDYIDLYQMHRYDDATPVEETLSTLNDLVRQGKVRYIGVSNWTASQIVEACLIIEAKGWEPLVSLQPQYSILARDIEVEILPACRKFGLGVIPWSPLAGGMLTGKYKPGEEPQEGTRFAAPGPFQSVWRTRSLNERNHAIVSGGAGGGAPAQRLADRGRAGLEPGAAGGRRRRSSGRRPSSSSATTWPRWTSSCPPRPSNASTRPASPTCPIRTTSCGWPGK